MASRRLFLMGLAAVAAAIFLACPGPASANGSGRSGKSDTGHLYLYEMTTFPGGSLVEGGAWAKLTYQYTEVAYDSSAAGSAAALYASHGQSDKNKTTGTWDGSDSFGNGKGGKNKNGDSSDYSGAEITNITFNAHGLEAGETYYLIYSVGADETGAKGSWVELASGQANGGGNLNINSSSLETGTLYDLLVWLVPASDWKQGTLSQVNTSDYLYATQLLFTDYSH